MYESMSKKRGRSESEDSREVDESSDDGILGVSYGSEDDECGREVDTGSAEEQPDQEEVERRERKRLKKIKKLKKAALEYQQKLEKRGMIYLSRIPGSGFMKPAKVRDMLEVYGTITNLYLAPEDKSLRRNRKKSGGNTRRKFVEGWVEFENKKIARRVADTLNNTKLGGKKRGFYYDDMWNMRYLKGFKWRHLTEKISYDRRIRETRLNSEMARVTRENNAYIAKVEQAKLIEKIEQRKRAKNGGAAPEPRVHRSFKQIVTVQRSEESEKRSFKHSTLSKVFSGSR